MRLIGRKLTKATKTAKHLAKDVKIVLYRLIGIQKDDDGAEDEFGRFTLFSKLPFDIRILIWSMVDLEPCVITQLMTEKRKPMFRFPRSIPAVLRTCRESRYEFLDVNGYKPHYNQYRRWRNQDLDDGQVVIHKRDHPTYKLFFTASGQKYISRPVFFSTEIDTFWGCHCIKEPGISFTYTKPTGEIQLHDCHYSRFAEMDIVSRLENVVMYTDFNFIGILPYLPRLKNLTFVYPTYLCDTRDPIFPHTFGRPILGPEGEDGEISTEGLPLAFRRQLDYDRFRIANLMSQLAVLHPDFPFPVIKFRAVEQYVAAECPHNTLTKAGWRKFK
jgi:hypothetical protein